MTTTDETMMTDPTEMQIPDDVMEAAKEAASYIMEWPDDLTCRVIARAIMAERERAAKVAYTYSDEHSGDHKMVGHIIGRKILFTKR